MMTYICWWGQSGQRSYVKVQRSY